MPRWLSHTLGTWRRLSCTPGSHSIPGLYAWLCVLIRTLLRQRTRFIYTSSRARGHAARHRSATPAHQHNPCGRPGIKDHRSRRSADHRQPSVPGRGGPHCLKNGPCGPGRQGVRGGRSHDRRAHVQVPLPWLRGRPQGPDPREAQTVTRHFRGPVSMHAALARRDTWRYPWRRLAQAGRHGLVRRTGCRFCGPGVPNSVTVHRTISARPLLAYDGRSMAGWHAAHANSHTCSRRCSASEVSESTAPGNFISCNSRLHRWPSSSALSKDALALSSSMRTTWVVYDREGTLL